MNKDCSILISSCDAYADILDIFFAFFKKNWKNCNYQIYLSTESLEYKDNDLSIINIHPYRKNVSWTERIELALKEIKTDNILLILDDMFLLEKIDEETFDLYNKYLKKNKKIANITFWPIMCDCVESNYKNLLLRERNANYKVAAIISLWNKNKLLKYVSGFKENIWEFEKNATFRANEYYPKDEFYVTTSIKSNCIYYDFSKYGLFSGKWFHENVKLFKENNIKCNFDDRSFYDPTYRGTENSIIKAFSTESYIVSYTKEAKKVKSLHCKKEISCGKFEQNYYIDKGKYMIYWEVGKQWGFAISNLKITLIYEDESENQNVEIYGSFVRKDDLIIFNNGTPYIYIYDKLGKNIKKVTIDGTLKIPCEKNILRLSYKKSTPIPSDAEIMKIYEKIMVEFLLLKEKMCYRILQPEIDIYENNTKKKNVKEKLVYKKRKFVCKYIINDNVSNFAWSPTNQYGFVIYNLKFIIKYKNGVCKKVEFNCNRKKLPKNNYLINNKLVFNTKFDKCFIKEIIITGKKRNITYRDIKKIL